MPISPIGYKGTPIQLIDEIPADCCGNASSKKRSRRQTLLTEATYPSFLSYSEDDDDCENDTNSLIAVAISEDSEDDSSDDLASVDSHFFFDASEKMKDCSSHSRSSSSSICDDDSTLCGREHPLLHMLEESSVALASLIKCPVPLSPLIKPDDENLKPLQTESHDTVRAKKEVQTKSQVKIARSSTSRWKDALQFEFQHALPGICATILYCVAHASVYELVSNLAYEAVEGEPVSASPSPTNTTRSKTPIYVAMLVLGCLLARVTGLIWEFCGPLAYKRAKFDYHNRLRLGVRDARWLLWLHKRGEVAVGCLHVVAYYTCYIAVVFFLSKLAVACDQRDEILSQLPSRLYQQSVDLMRETKPILRMCPIQDYSPEALFGNQTSHEFVGYHWDPLACPEQEQELEIFGPEDDQYFYQRLSKNSYELFFGQEYETAFFDAPHQILFYATVAGVALYAMKAGLSFSFWAGW